MSMRRWLLSGLVLAAGCATMQGNRVSDREVAQLPAQDRAQIIEANRSIDVAQNNIETSKLQLDEAQQFRQIAATELKAADAREQAAMNALMLARRTRTADQLRAAQEEDDAAHAQQTSARAKLSYADRLVALRQARLDEANAELQVARANVNVRKAQLVEREGIARPDIFAIRNDQDQAQRKLAQARATVATLQGEVQQLRTAWLHRARNTASRDTNVPLMPPPARPMLPNPSLQGDVNDTPAAPDQRQSQEPQNGIAPNP